MATHISVPHPCPAQYADMTPVPGGRHCASCNKVVVDFGELTEAEAVDYLRRHPGACGRFQPTHLHPLPAWAAWMVAAVTALTSCESPSGTNTTSTPPDSVVRGVVLAQGSGHPLAHALIISEQDTTLHTYTGSDGSFVLPLPAALRGSRLVAAVIPNKPVSADQILFFPRYFTATTAQAVQVQLRGHEPIVGQVALEEDEGYAPAVMPYLAPTAPPPPPPKLSTK